MSNDLARRHGLSDLPSTETSGAITQALEGLKAIRTFVKEQFKPGVDAGVIPGCGDKATLLAGAQKATMYFNAFPTYRVREADLGGGHVEFRVRCLLMSRANGRQIGEGIGLCSTKEKKYKRGGAAKVCPSCGKAAIYKSKEEYGGGWYCNVKADGCGAKFSRTHRGLNEAPTAEVADDSAYEVRNTVLKMAKKRAHVDAAMTLGCLSELFTQDIEDTYPMIAVRETGRPAEPEPEPEPEPYHIDGEIVEDLEEHRNARKSAPGLFTKDAVTKTRAFNDWMSRKCDITNEAWAAEWHTKLDGAFEAGLSIPATIHPVINPWQAKSHLLKWLVETGQLEDVKAEAQRTRQVDAYVASVFYRDESTKAAVKAEMGSYVAEQRREKADAIYKKCPDLAPAGWAEEQAEAQAPPESAIEPVAKVVPEPEDHPVPSPYGDGPAPNTGQALAIWAKLMENRFDFALLKHLSHWGKERRLPLRIAVWPEEDVVRAHQEGLRKLKAISEERGAEEAELDRGDAYEGPDDAREEIVI